MIVNMQSMPLTALGDLAGVCGRAPRVWCQLDSQVQAQLAQCWAKLVQRMCRRPTKRPGGEHGPGE
jgi:hypothetical protein